MYFSQILRAQFFHHFQGPRVSKSGAQGPSAGGALPLRSGSGDCQKRKGCRCPEMHYHAAPLSEAQMSDSR